jgi:hypothetical protein
MADVRQHRIKLKIGDAEFDAEGDAEIVKSQFEQWLALVKDKPAAAAATAVQSQPAGGQTDALLARVFAQRPDGTVTLKVLPKGKTRESDALLLLLYGYKRVKGTENIYGTQLMKAARFSGVQLERIDRTLNVHQQFFMRGGQRRSANYTLNNRGVARAEEIMAEIFE